MIGSFILNLAKNNFDLINLNKIISCRSESKRHGEKKENLN